MHPWLEQQGGVATADTMAAEPEVVAAGIWLGEPGQAQARGHVGVGRRRRLGHLVLALEAGRYR